MGYNHIHQLRSTAPDTIKRITTTSSVLTTVKAASCHMVAVATTTDSNQHSRTTLCAATADKLVLLTWSVNSREFNVFEVMKLTGESFTRDPDDSVATVNYPGQTFIDMTRPKMLGVSGGSEVVFVSHLTERSALQMVAMSGAQVYGEDTGFSCSNLDTVQTKDIADTHTNFSFTSSLVLSLDGSEADDENAGRRVRFGQDIMHTEV